MFSVQASTRSKLQKENVPLFESTLDARHGPVRWRPYRAVPLRYWQSDNRTSTAVLPHLRATQEGNLARPHSHGPQAVRKPEGLAMHCHLHRGDWSFHLTNEKKRPTESFGERLRHCGRLRTWPYSPEWRSSMTGNAEEEEEETTLRMGRSSVADYHWKN